MPLSENNILFYWTAPEGVCFFVWKRTEKTQDIPRKRIHPVFCCGLGIPLFTEEECVYFFQFLGGCTFLCFQLRNQIVFTAALDNVFGNAAQRKG